MTRLSDGKLKASPKRTALKKLWNASCIEPGDEGELAVMSEILSEAFVIGFLLVYAGLLVALLLWNLGPRLRGPSKKRTWSRILQHLSTLRFFNGSYDAANQSSGASIPPAGKTHDSGIE
jgi:hypothetical protein